MKKTRTMRRLLICAVVIFVVAVSAGFGDSRPKISQIPDGTFTNGVYANATAGVKIQTPKGWIVTVDPKDPVAPGTQSENVLLNQCSKGLVSFRASKPAEGDFTATGLLFVIDPNCYPAMKVPSSVKDQKGIARFVNTIVPALMYTGFVIPTNASAGVGPGINIGIDADQEPWGPMIFITTDGTVSVTCDTGKKPLHEIAVISLTRFRDNWVVLATIADEASQKELVDTNNTMLRFAAP